MKSTLSIVSNSGRSSAQHCSELPEQRDTCDRISDSLPPWIRSAWTRVRLRTRYLTWLPRISLSEASEVSHSITCARQTALERDSCIWSWQEETGKKYKLHELHCSLAQLCFCVPEELSRKGRRVQKVLQVLPVQEHSRACHNWLYCIHLCHKV